MLVRRAGRVILRDRGIQTWMRRKHEGLRLLTDAEIPEFTQHKRRKAFRQTTQAKKALAVVDTSKLSMHQRQQVESERNRLTVERRTMLSSIRQLSVLSRPPQTGDRHRLASA